MKIVCIFIGKTKEEYIKTGIKSYLKRIRPFINIEINEIKTSHTGNVEEAKLEEYKMIQKHIKSTDVLILLDEHGASFTSRDMADYLNNLLNTTKGRIIFVIGNAYGHHQELITQSKHILSLSRLTFNHQLVRLILMEQLYRSATIIKGHPYHND